MLDATDEGLWGSRCIFGQGTRAIEKSKEAFMQLTRVLEG